ncbi:AAA family ATPase [Fibrobacter succinogenes]|uniref:AAA family ATPase n=1 Tax=Fibrobacter succinogenes TaxID=833 RepID=UPI0015689FC4|nr:AAA family ATPase [Fibrobacter succinogenes]
MEQKNLFCIAALKIGKDCSKIVRKNLKPGFYFFNNRCCLENDKIVLNPEYNIEENIYGKNIFLHAIVGMNGSGKSSLLELIYRMVNNFSFLLDVKKRERSNLLFVCGIDAELYYTINDILYTLVCKGESVYLIEKKNECEETIISEETSDIIGVTKNFFYSIVTNYSMQSLISSDYKGEKCFEIPGVGRTTMKSWIHRIFHKNDGYATAIVLNPYRSEDGWIDVGKEERFTVSRLSSLLYYFEKKGLRLINEYGLKNVTFKYDRQYVRERLNPWLKELAKKEYIKNQTFEKADKKICPEYDSELNDFLLDVQNIFFDLGSFLKGNPNTIFGIIAKEFGFDEKAVYDEMEIYSYGYLAYKVLSIVSKYSLYSNYQDLGNILKLDRIVLGKEKSLLTSLVNKIINEDKSHITVKVHQVYNFLNSYDSVKKLSRKPNGFSVEDYLKCLKFDSTDASLMDLKRHLPPPFFVPSVFLYKDQHGYKKTINNIPFEKLSSGERQLFSTLSTCVYHIENLMSVKSKDIPKYNNVNLIFEEIEISFHPDYQRCFVDNLISMIERLGYNNKFMINIILVTHSPFVLSDVPKQNILYLKNGRDVSDTIRVNPFAANICDVLHQSFFLENGFIGAYAQKQIDKLIDSFDSKKRIDKEKIKSRINNLIGEPIIRDYMLDKIAQEE